MSGSRPDQSVESGSEKGPAGIEIGCGLTKIRDLIEVGSFQSQTTRDPIAIGLYSTK